MKDKIVRSPFFYVGDKYKLMPQLKQLFPQGISTYIEPFAGGGSSFLNTKADRYVVNDIDPYVIELHRWLTSFKGNRQDLKTKLFNLIDDYGLSCSCCGVCVPEELKKQYVKTYYSHYNKEAYIKLRNDYNKRQDTARLYLLLIYGFNHMIRFNSAGLFNLPVGNVDFNNNVYQAIDNYLDFMEGANVEFFNQDYSEFLNSINIKKQDFVYFDPPYLISGSEYNKLWNRNEEIRLCECLDELNSQGILFGITNLIYHKNRSNDIFIEWSKKYNVYSIDSNYISFNDNTIKTGSEEVYVTNYGKI